MTPPTPAERRSSPAPLRPGRRLAAGAGWLLLWLPGALLGLALAGMLALWVWAATPGSLAQTLDLARQPLQKNPAGWGELSFEGVTGSLRSGGQLARLRWSRGGLVVQALGIDVGWDGGTLVNALLGQELHLPALSIEQLTVQDSRAPTAPEPPAVWTWPMPVTVAFRVQRLDVQGQTRLSAFGLRGRYLFGPAAAASEAPPLPITPGVTAAHRLLIDSLQWADGRYTARASLGAQSPMPLQLTLQGQVDSPLPDGSRLPLMAEAQVSGLLAPPGTVLDINASLRAADAAAAGPAAALLLAAQLKPWALQPLLSARIEMRQLNLSALWPGAPVTSLTGSLQAQPEGEQWRASVSVDNTRPAALDRQGLPLQSLQAEIARAGDQWTVSALRARMADGVVQGQARFTLSPAEGRYSVSRWQGELALDGVRPAQLWSTLAPGALGGRLSAQAAAAPASAGAIDFLASLRASNRHSAGDSRADVGLDSLFLQGRWTPAAVALAGAAPAGLPPGLLDLSEVRLDAMDARLGGRGQIDTVRRSLAGAWTLELPGARASVSGLLDARQGGGELRANLQHAGRALDWVRGLQRLPLLPAHLRETLQRGAGGRAEGQGSLLVKWQGGLAALGWPAAPAARAQAGGTVNGASGTGGLAAGGQAAAAEPPGSTGLAAPAGPAGRADAAGRGGSPVAVPPRLDATLAVPRLRWQGPVGLPTEFSDWAASATGTPHALQVALRGAAQRSGWKASLDTKGQWSGQTPDRLAGQAAGQPAGQTAVQKADQTAGATDIWQLGLSRLRLQLRPADGSPSHRGWDLQSEAPLALVWSQRPGAGQSLDAGAGRLLVGLDSAGHATTPVSSAAPTASRAPGPATPLTLSWQRLVWQPQSLETRGQLQGLTLGWIEALAQLGVGANRGAGNEPVEGLSAELGAALRGDLVLDAQWDMSLPLQSTSPWRLNASLQRRQGDLLWSGGAGLAGPGAAQAGVSSEVQPASAAPASPIAAGVRGARLDVTVQGRQLQAALRWDSERLGTASADLSTTLANPADTEATATGLDRWWPKDAPVRGSAQVDLPQVGVWSLLAPPGWRMQGTVNAQASLGGTRSAPDWRGSLQADQLALRSVVEGIAFGNGQLRATLAGERLQIQRFSLQGPGGAASGGTLVARGQAEWRPVPGSLLRQPFIELQARASQLRLSSRPDRRLALSGELNATLAGQSLQWRGQLKADSALFILPDETTPRLGPDVVVRRTSELPVETPTASRVQNDVSVTLDLGPQFVVRGQGVQTRLEGQLAVRATPAQPVPTLTGEVRTAGGTYRAYNQQLAIESGELRFSGPYDDPALDIRAIRALPENSNQRVGVQVTGTALAPRVALFAEPDLPDGDKLAWLLLGRPASAAGAQAFVLQQAARRLLSRNGEPLDGALARTLGLDQLGFSDAGASADGTASTTALTLGKRLSSDLYLSYEQSLSGSMSTVSILYDLSRRLTLRARAGTENAIDLIFSHRYD